MERARRGWYEREEIQKVTLDWINTNCNLTQREKEILQLVYDRKLIRRDHLETISPSFRSVGANRTVLLNRAIKKLYGKMCLDKVHEPQEIGKGNKPSIVGLDKAGSLILGVPHKRRIAHKKSIFKGKEYITRSLPANFKHINGINQLEVDTILYCEESNCILETWKHELGREIYYGTEKILIIPDIYMELLIKDKKLICFIEFDTGSENHRYKSNFPIIHDKIIKYKKYKVSKVWEDNFEYFPMLLLVTEDNKRIPYFNQKCKELGLQGFGVYHKNYTNFLRHLSSMV